MRPLCAPARQDYQHISASGRDSDRRASPLSGAGTAAWSLVPQPACMESARRLLRRLPGANQSACVIPLEASTQQAYMSWLRSRLHDMEKTPRERPSPHSCYAARAAHGRPGFL